MKKKLLPGKEKFRNPRSVNIRPSSRYHGNSGIFKSLLLNGPTKQINSPAADEPNPRNVFNFGRRETDPTSISLVPNTSARGATYAAESSAVSG
jgi:hypothetical protein